MRNPFGADVSESDIKEWLSQFAENEQWAIIPLIECFRYFDANTLVTTLKKLHRLLLANYGASLDHMWFVPVGYVAQTGAAVASSVAFLYELANGVPTSRFIAAEDLQSKDLQDSLIVFLDDFIGSGVYATDLWNSTQRDFSNCTSARWVFASAVGYRSGIDVIREETGFDVIVGEELPSSQQPFKLDSEIFRQNDERLRAREIVQRHCSHLEPTIELGRGGAQALVGFFFGTPDSTLPIFWSTNRGWRPLRPLLGSTGVNHYGNPRLPGPAPQTSHVTSPDGHRSVTELRKTIAYSVPIEVATQLLHEFQTTENFLVIAPIITMLSVSH